MTHAYKPMMMGAAMGLMMLWMVHGQLTGSNAMSGPALAVFVAVHVILVFLLVGAGLFAARLSPRLRRLAARLHRPSPGHIGWMLCGALGAAAVVHFGLHGI